MTIKFIKAHRSTKLKQEPSNQIFVFLIFPNFHQTPKSSIQILKHRSKDYLLALPRVYPSHHFENIPPLAACSFQLARRVAISGLEDSRFCVCRFEKRPELEPAELRRWSPEVPSVCFPFEEVEVLESFILEC
jgi:hypothetical protein